MTVATRPLVLRSLGLGVLGAWLKCWNCDVVYETEVNEVR
jgi:hypothetical protein